MIFIGVLTGSVGGIIGINFKEATDHTDIKVLRNEIKLI
jgi:hypothetical protein